MLTQKVLTPRYQRVTPKAGWSNVLAHTIKTDLVTGARYAELKLDCGCTAIQMTTGPACTGVKTVKQVQCVKCGSKPAAPPKPRDPRISKSYFATPIAERAKQC